MSPVQNHREVDKMGKGASGAVRIDDAKGGTTLTYGRHFAADSGNLYSSITRETINALKAHFRDQVWCGSRNCSGTTFTCVFVYVLKMSQFVLMVAASH